MTPDYVHDLLDTLISGATLNFHHHPVPDDVRHRILHRTGRPVPRPEATPPVLSDRELQILTGFAAGGSNKEIGEALFIAEDTVKTHCRRLFRKLGARDRAHAVAIAMRAGVLK